LNKEGMLLCLGAPYLIKASSKAKWELKAALVGKYKDRRFFFNTA